MEAVFSMVRKINGKQPGDLMEDLNVNLAIWEMFMNTTLRAALHLGKDYDTNLRCKELSMENNRTAFQGNRKADQWSDKNHWHKPDQFPRFKVGIDKLIAQSSLSISTAMVHVFSDSVLCLGKMGDNPVESWKSKIQWYSDNDYFRELNRIDGQPIEFEWKILAGLAAAGILNEIQQMMGELQCEPENFTGRIIFMSMFNDMVWDAMMNYVSIIQR